MKVKHYKGGIYTIITDARHTEEGYEHVIYKDEVGNVWARPSEMFWGKVLVDGELVDRFTEVKNMVKVTNENIYSLISAWHDGESDLEVYEYLGLTFEEYKHWVETDELPSNCGFEEAVERLVSEEYSIEDIKEALSKMIKEIMKNPITTGSLDEYLDGITDEND